MKSTVLQTAAKLAKGGEKWKGSELYYAREALNQLWDDLTGDEQDEWNEKANAVNEAIDAGPPLDELFKYVAYLVLSAASH